MKTKILICTAALLCASQATVAQVVGIQPLGITVEQTNALLQGWSVRKALVDEPVYNDTNEKVGSIYDVIIAPDRKATYAILSVGGFLGVATHYVAIPVDHFDIRSGNLYLAGATKAALKGVPEFQYGKLQKATKPSKIKTQ